MRIYLLGFMGSGKSSLGKRLAKKLDCLFVDLDDEVKRLAGRPIDEIFMMFGEDYFRQLEQQALHKTLLLNRAVIATGGGTPCFFDNMAFINNHGTSVYLRMSPGSLASRLTNAQKKRPLIQNLSQANLPAFIESKLKEREVYYMQSKCIIKGETVKADQVISLVFGQ